MLAALVHALPPRSLLAAAQCDHSTQLVGRSRVAGRGNGIDDDLDRSVARRVIGDHLPLAVAHVVEDRCEVVGASERCDVGLVPRNA